jgi:outer membrane lipoprotein-sorting protein
LTFEMRNQRKRISFFLISLLLSSSGGSATPRKRHPRVILKVVAEKYAAFRFYRDEGSVITTYDDATGGRIEKMPFKLFFKRPNRFRFEWVDYYLWKNGKTTVVWCNGKDTFLYEQPDIHEKKESLESGIATVTGVSDGAAYNIPRLLLPNINGWTFTDLKKPTMLRGEVFEGDFCYRIKGLDESGNVNEIWISKRDFLVRKIRTQSAFTDFSTIEEEVHRHIRVNQPIPEENFNYQPPIALRAPKKPPPGGVLFADEAPTWAEFVSEEGRFKLMMPDMPRSQTLTIESPQGLIVHHSFVANKGGFICILDYADLPKQFGGPADSEALFDQARDEFLKEAQAKLSSETKIIHEGYPGREMRMHLYGGEARARFFLIEGRFYQLAITRVDVPSKSDDAMDRFFNSFKVTPASKRIALRSR